MNKNIKYNNVMTYTYKSSVSEKKQQTNILHPSLAEEETHIYIREYNSHSQTYGTLYTNTNT